MKKIAFFLPTRKGSERVVNKNTRPFANIKGGLLKIKIDQLLKVPEIPIYISTNDPETISIARSYNNDRLRIFERPDNLCQSSTLMSDFIKYVPTIVNEEHIIWVHVTEPFVGHHRLLEAINIYFESLQNGKYDSLMSCNKIQTFVWDKENKNYISHNKNDVKWPRSQDLKVFYEINSAIFINSKENFVRLNDRIGNNPYLFELTKLESIDIDWEDDFKMAELLYNATREV